MNNNVNDQYLISDGKVHVHGLDYWQLIEYMNKFALEESGNGLDYSASIHELQADKDYLVTFHGRMPLETLTDLVWELNYCDDAQRTVTAYTNCNRFGLPANAMFCMYETISEYEAIAVDNQGQVYIIDDESKSLNYKLTNKTARYTSWVEWKYTDDNSSFVMSDDDIHDPLQVGDTCIVDWRQGVLGWPVVRGIVKK